MDRRYRQISLRDRPDRPDPLGSTLTMPTGADGTAYLHAAAPGRRNGPKDTGGSLRPPPAVHGGSLLHKLFPVA